MSEKRINLHIFALLAATLFVLICTPVMADETDPTPESTRLVVNELLQEFYAASTFADIETIDRLVSNSPQATFLGTAPGELFQGHDEIVEWWQGIFDFLESFGYPNNGGLPLVSTGEPVQVERRGSVIWVVDEPMFQFQNGDAPTRLTLVLKIEQGEWKIAQGHFSIGIADNTLPL